MNYALFVWLYCQIPNYGLIINNVKRCSAVFCDFFTCFDWLAVVLLCIVIFTFTRFFHIIFSTNLVIISFSLYVCIYVCIHSLCCLCFMHGLNIL